MVPLESFKAVVLYNKSGKGRKFKCKYSQGSTRLHVNIPRERVPVLGWELFQLPVVGLAPEHFNRQHMTYGSRRWLTGW